MKPDVVVHASKPSTLEAGHEDLKFEDILGYTEIPSLKKTRAEDVTITIKRCQGGKEGEIRNSVFF
jgi:hypothetical protein